MRSVVLICPHSHDGQPYEAQQRLDVDGATARWLIANGIARHERQSASAAQREGRSASAESKTTQRKESGS